MKYLLLILFVISCNNKPYINTDNKKDYYSIKPSLYGEDLKIIVCSTKEAKTKVDENYDFEGLEGLTISEKGTILIWISDSATESTLVHESFHATYAIMNWVGIKLSPESEEAFAYLQEDIYKNISNVFYSSYEIE